MDTLRNAPVKDEITYHGERCFKVDKDIFNRRLHNKKKVNPLSIRPTVTSACHRDTDIQGNAFRIQSAPAAVRHSGTRRPHNVKINEWIGKAPIIGDKDKLKRESATADVSFHELNNQEAILNEDIHKILQSETSIRDQKNVQLHKQWTRAVFTPLTVRLGAIMNQQRTKLKERQHHYQHYIDYLNKKGFVFLDTASTDDYDPIPKQSRGNTKVVLPLDPLEWQQNKAYIESEIANACTSGKRITLSSHKRQNNLSSSLDKQNKSSDAKTDRSSWLSMELYDIQSKVRQRSQMKMTGQTNAASADFWTSNYRFQNDNPCQSTKYQKRPFSMKHHTELVFV